MKKLISIFLVASTLLFTSGCVSSLIPKRVELFQDKVRKFPEPSASEKETQRQAAARAADAAKQTLVAAVEAEAPLTVTDPAKDTVKLTDSVSRSLGPPLKHSVDPADVLSEKLDRAVAKLNERLDNFKDDNDENAGKKIEGTGLLQVPYFVWLAGAAVMLFVGLIVVSVLWTVLKTVALTNAPLSAGMGAVSLAGNTVKKGFSQLIKGGENFKEALKDKVSDPKLTEEILELFRVEHERAQDVDIQATVQHITK